MINIKAYKLIPCEGVDNKYRVRSEEQSICPVCSNTVLKVIGSRDRKVTKSCGQKIILVIRRLRCNGCKRLHHELPDIIVPYKRHSSESIEAILSDMENTIPCEESTIYRIRKWFQDFSTYFAGVLSGVVKGVEREALINQPSAMQRIKSCVGTGVGWLERTVRIIVNTNNWVHTRSAFLT